MRPFFCVALLGLAGCAASGGAQVELKGKQFAVEIADDDEERARGLMFRESMADDHGMLFVFDEDAPQSFWMKNTFIPLDMVFIREDGEVASIAKNAQPQSLAIISSGVRATKFHHIKIVSLNGSPPISSSCDAASHCIEIE